MAVTFTPTGGNDTAALQAVVDGLGSGGGKIVVASGSGCGLAALDLSNAGPVWIEGEGKGGTRFVAVGPDTPVFRTAPGTDKDKFKFSNFTVTKSVPRTGGAYFDFGGPLRRSVLEDLELEGHFNGISLPAFEVNVMNRLDIVKPSGAGAAIILGTYGTAGSGSGIELTSLFIRGNNDRTGDAPTGSCGIAAYDINALSTDHVDIGGMRDNNMIVRPAIAAKDFFLQKFISDATQQGHGVLVYGEGVKTQWTITGSWFASAGKLPGGNPVWARESCGLLWAGPGGIGTISVNSSRFFNNSGSGMLCTISNRLQLVGNTFESNGADGILQRHGFAFMPPSPMGAPMLVGNDFTANTPSAYYFGPNASGQFLADNRLQ